MTRRAIPETVQEEILTKSARRCALCFGLDGLLARVRGQLAHIDGNHENSTAENLVYLCLPHHDEYDSTTSQSKGFTEREVRSYRERLYDAIRTGQHHSDNERKASARPDYIEHDRAAFRAGESILNESYLRDFLDHVANDHSYRVGRLYPLDRFVEHFRTESGRYLISDLLLPLDELLSSIDDLSLFLAQHFFPYPDAQRHAEDGDRCCLYPDHNLDRHGTGSHEEMVFYDAHARKLRKAIDLVDAAFREYRRTIKQTLVV